MTKFHKITCIFLLFLSAGYSCIQTKTDNKENSEQLDSTPLSLVENTNNEDSYNQNINSLPESMAFESINMFIENITHYDERIESYYLIDSNTFFVSFFVNQRGYQSDYAIYRKKNSVFKLAYILNKQYPVKSIINTFEDFQIMNKLSKTEECSQIFNDKLFLILNIRTSPILVLNWDGTSLTESIKISNLNYIFINKAENCKIYFVVDNYDLGSNTYENKLLTEYVNIDIIDKDKIEMIGQQFITRLKKYTYIYFENDGQTNILDKPDNFIKTSLYNYYLTLHIENKGFISFYLLFEYSKLFDFDTDKLFKDYEQTIKHSDNSNIDEIISSLKENSIN